MGANLKFAILYLAVGVVLFLANQFAKQPQGDGNQRNAVLNVGLDLSVGRKPEPTGAGTGNALIEESTYKPIRLLSVCPGTNRPIGRLFCRTSRRSEWVVLFVAPGAHVYFDSAECRRQGRLC